MISYERRQTDPAAAAAEGAVVVLVFFGQVDGLAEVADGEQGSGSKRMSLHLK